MANIDMAVDYDDRPTNAGMFLLHAVRHQLCGPGGLEALEYGFLRAFGLSGFEKALVAFMDITQVLRAGTRRPLGLNPVSRKSVTRDEATIVSCLEALHNGECAKSRLMVEWMVQPRFQQQLHAALTTFAANLGDHMWSPSTASCTREDELHGTDHAPDIAAVPRSALKLDDLTVAERALVHAARLWVEEYKARGETGRKGPFARINDYLSANGLPDAASSLNCVLYNISVAAQRSVFIPCTDCPGVSMDEAIILAAIANHQSHRTDAARTGLTGLLSVSAAELTLGAIGGLANLLTERGHVLPVRSSGPANDCREERPADFR